jgi:hypothetical protein
MKPFAALRASILVTLLLFLGSSVRAQLFDSSVGIGAGLGKLFGNVTGFSARAVVQVLDTNRQEVLQSPMTFGLLDGKVRMEFDMSQMHGKSVQPALISALKKIGMERVTSIIRVDQRLIYVVFTGARSYVPMEMSKEEAEAAQKNVQVLRTPLGKETIDKHPCTKNKVLVKNSRGQTLLEATTWNASDLKDFPVLIGVQAKEGITFLRFSQIQMTRPPAAQFNPPAGYTQYTSTDMLMLAATQKQMTGASGSNVSKSPSSTRPATPAKPAPRSSSGPAPRKPAPAATRK